VFGGLPRAVVGLDVGSTSVKAVRLEHSRKGTALAGLALQEIDSGGGTEEKDAARLAATKKALEQCGAGAISGTPIVTAVSGPGVSIKHVAFPSMPPNELAESIRWEARKHVPFGESEFVLDFQVLDGAARKKDDTTGMRVLLTSADRRVVDAHVALLKAAGVEVDTVDLAPLALMNEADEQGLLNGEAVAVADLGASGVNLSVYKRGGYLFARTVPVATSGGRGDGTQWIDAAVREVARSLTFYHNESGKETIEKVYLSGGRSLAPGVLDAFRKATGIGTALLDPFAGLGPLSPDAEPLRAQGARFALAMGLARRRT